MAKKQTHRQEVKRKRKLEAKEQQTLEQSRAQRRRLAGRIGLYVVVSSVVLVSAYWAYGKLTEKVTWTNVPLLPSPHSPLDDPHPPYNSDPPTSG
ncbi:MAG: hypothetical protein ACREJ6_11350, partial [Candidatus Methylomirabilis sp.]